MFKIQIEQHLRAYSALTVRQSTEDAVRSDYHELLSNVAAAAKDCQSWAVADIARYHTEKNHFLQSIIAEELVQVGCLDRKKIQRSVETLVWHGCLWTDEPYTMALRSDQQCSERQDLVLVKQD